MKTETITWHELPADGMPDAETTPQDECHRPAVGGPVERIVGRPVEQRATVATVTECEACFTPDVCRLRGTCDHYRAELLRIAARELPPQVPNEHGHLLTTEALWGMYIEDGEPPNARIKPRRQASA